MGGGRDKKSEHVLLSYICIRPIYHMHLTCTIRLLATYSDFYLTPFPLFKDNVLIVAMRNQCYQMLVSSRETIFIQNQSEAVSLA